MVKTDFEAYCYKERMKQLNYNMPFLRVFGVRLFLFFPKVILGFDVVKFDHWLGTKDNQSTYDSVLEKYGQAGVNLIKKLVE